MKESPWNLLISIYGIILFASIQKFLQSLSCDRYFTFKCKFYFCLFWWWVWQINLSGHAQSWAIVEYLCEMYSPNYRTRKISLEINLQACRSLWVADCSSNSHWATHLLIHTTENWYLGSDTLQLRHRCNMKITIKKTNIKKQICTSKVDECLSDL